jgi:hypothetical protein
MCFCFNLKEIKNKYTNVILLLLSFGSQYSAPDSLPIGALLTQWRLA